MDYCKQTKREEEKECPLDQIMFYLRDMGIFTWYSEGRWSSLGPLVEMGG